MSEMTPQEILTAVAEGRLDPAEAAVLLEAAEPAKPSTSDVVGSDRQVPLEGRISTAPLPAEVQRVVVHATSRRVRVIGDPTVATIDVAGGHTLRREGTTLHVSGEVELVPTEDAFTLISGGRWREMADRVASVGQNLELTVRVRPDLPVGVEVIAGSAVIENATAVDHVRVTGGSLRVSGAEHPLDVLVQAGSAQVSARVVAGKSRLRCESGSLQVELLPGSDARVRTDVQLGKLSVSPELSARERGRDIVVGTGGAELDIEAMMAAVTLELPKRGGTP